MKLYQDRYLIAIYDINDKFIECSNSLSGFTLFSKIQVVSMVRPDRREVQQHDYYKAYLIDCLEPHDDCFAEEDRIFLDEEEEIEKYLKTLPQPKKYLKGRSSANLQVKGKIRGQSVKFIQKNHDMSAKKYIKRKARGLTNANTRATKDN